MLVSTMGLQRGALKLVLFSLSFRYWHLGIAIGQRPGPDVVPLHLIAQPMDCAPVRRLRARLAALVRYDVAVLCAISVYTSQYVQYACMYRIPCRGNESSGERGRMECAARLKRVQAKSRIFSGAPSVDPHQAIPVRSVPSIGEDRPLVVTVMIGERVSRSSMMCARLSLMATAEQ